MYRYYRSIRNLYVEAIESLDHLQTEVAINEVCSDAWAYTCGNGHEHFAYIFFTALFEFCPEELPDGSGVFSRHFSTRR